MEKICVMGLGYIGLPMGSLLATKGFKVHGVDVKQEVVDTINRGTIHIYEPDLDILVKSAVQSGNLTASLEPEQADVFIVAVPTPFKANHVPDISYVEKASEAIAPYIEPGNLVIVESTIPVETTERVADIIRRLRPELTIPIRKSFTPFKGPEPVYIAHCPERVLPGQILRELIDNDRIIGGIDKKSAEVAQAFYHKFINGQGLITDSRTAEMAKLTENSFRDVNIAFANELSLICERLDINVWELIEMANRHPRVNILQPGPGVGGHCIAVDPWFVVDAAPEEARLIRTAREVNDSKPHYVFNKVRDKAQRLKDPVIACLGLSFKADIDDLRESPSLDIVKNLASEAVGKILVVEPHILELPPELAEFSNLEFSDLTSALHTADIILLLVNHREFKDVNHDLLNEKIVIDTRGAWR